MKTNSFVALVAVLFSLLFANFAMADDNNNSFQGTQTQTVTANPTATATVTGVTANVDHSGNAMLINNQQRDFVSPVGGYQVATPNGPANTDKHHRPAQASNISVQFSINQESFNAMVDFLKKAHKMDSNTRTWDDMREDLVIQPRFDYPKPELSDKKKVRVLSAASINFNALTEEDLVGLISVRDRKPSANSVDKMYLVEAIYPLVKLGGGDVLVKVDDFFWEVIHSSAFGGGFGGALSSILSCMTGGSIAANVGASSGNARMDVVGGELYLALRSPKMKPVFTPSPPLPAPPVEIKKPEVCNPSFFEAQITFWSDTTRFCPDPCLNNASLRFQLGNSNAGGFDCTKDEKYANQAIAEYDAGERDILRGVEPDGTATRNTAGGQKLLRDIRFNKSWLILKLHDQDAQFGYARNNQLSAVPSTYKDLVKFQ